MKLARKADHGLLFNHLDPNLAIAACAVFPNPAVAANFFYHIFPKRTHQKLSAAFRHPIYQIKANKRSFACRFHKLKNLGRTLNIDMLGNLVDNFEVKSENHGEIPHVQHRSIGSIGLNTSVGQVGPVG